MRKQPTKTQINQQKTLAPRILSLTELAQAQGGNMMKKRHEMAMSVIQNLR